MSETTTPRKPDATPNEKDVITAKAAPLCPHCKAPLREEHDLGDHLHCDNSACIECCFEPGSPPVLRANYPSCPASGR